MPYLVGFSKGHKTGTVAVAVAVAAAAVVLLEFSSRTGSRWFLLPVGEVLSLLLDFFLSHLASRSDALIKEF